MFIGFNVYINNPLKILQFGLYFLLYRDTLYLILASIHIFSLKTLKGCNGDVCDESVQFVRGILIVVSPPAQSYSYPEGNVPGKRKK